MMGAVDLIKSLKGIASGSEGGRWCSERKILQIKTNWKVKAGRNVAQDFLLKKCSTFDIDDQVFRCASISLSHKQDKSINWLTFLRLL